MEGQCHGSLPKWEVIRNTIKWYSHILPEQITVFRHLSKEEQDHLIGDITDKSSTIIEYLKFLQRQDGKLHD